MSEPALKYENNAILRKTILQNCSLLIKRPILAVSAIDFQDFAPKSFITSTTDESSKTLIHLLSVNL